MPDTVRDDGLAAPFASNVRPLRHIALVLDPRFPGGTCSAVAAEIRALTGHVRLEVHALETAMFGKRGVNPVLQAALDDCGLELIRGAPVIRADTVALHNPSCLKFDSELAPRISCRAAFLITHENFLRPNGAEGFDITNCLNLISDRLLCGQRHLVPVSGNNRAGVAKWLELSHAGWELAEFDWFNICDFPQIPPEPAPRDRRGRHSRPGAEKFPDPATMQAQFPAHAERCAILGGDSFMDDAATPPPAHWTLHRFRALPVAEFLAGIDFFVYFTHPLWRESFGRVIAEAIAAGKLVITDPDTGRTFGQAVITDSGDNIDGIIAHYVSHPEEYVSFVRAAQKQLDAFGPAAFTARVLDGISGLEGKKHAFL